MYKQETSIATVDGQQVAKFKRNNSWVCFNEAGDVWVEEYGRKKNEFKTVIDAFDWVANFGDRD